jgi:hypothetical protein
MHPKENRDILNLLNFRTLLLGGIVLVHRVGFIVQCERSAPKVIFSLEFFSLSLSLGTTDLEILIEVKFLSNIEVDAFYSPQNEEVHGSDPCY